MIRANLDWLGLTCDTVGNEMAEELGGGASDCALELSSELQGLLFKVAKASIENGMHRHQPLAVAPEDYPLELRESRAVFVTLTLDGELRGCVGTLERGPTLIENVARYAYAAAFSDNRFLPLKPEELAQIKIQISILSRLEPIRFQSETDLLSQLRPGRDGLVLEEGNYRGTFLPSVWQEIPDRGDFLQRLKLKAGLPPDYWSASVQVHRYTALCVS